MNFYPIAEDPKSLLAGYDIQGLAPINGNTSAWASIFFGRGSSGQEYAVRLTSPQTTSSADRALEHAIAERLSDHGLGPHVYGAFPDDGVMLMERLRPTALNPRDGRQIDQLGKLLAGLHSIDLRSLPEVPGVTPKFTHAWAQLSQVLAHTNRFPAHKRALESWLQLHEDLEGRAPEAPVLCHNDVHPGNVLAGADGNLALIDNDHCSLGSGMFDIAAAAISLRLSPAGEQRLLRACGTSTSDLLFRSYKELYCLTYAGMLFSLIKDYDALDTRHVPRTDQAAGPGKLPGGTTPDKRRFTESWGYLRAAARHAAGADAPVDPRKARRQRHARARRQSLRDLNRRSR